MARDDDVTNKITGQNKSASDRIRKAADAVTEIAGKSASSASSRGSPVRPVAPQGDPDSVTERIVPGGGSAKKKSADAKSAKSEAAPKPSKSTGHSAPQGSSDRQEKTGFYTSTPVVGWLTIVDGPGRGCSIEISTGVNMIGRENENSIAVDFGDPAISRKDHVRLAYDDKSNAFTAIMGTSENIARINDQPIYQPTAMKAGDVLMLGETSLRFTPMCDKDFHWT